MDQERIAVTRSSMPPFEEYAAEIADIWDSRWLTNFGTKHNQLIERTYRLEEGLSVVRNDIESLKGKAD